MMGPETLTAEESAALLAWLRRGVAVSGMRALGVRNWGMAMVMLEAGLRVAELVGLNIGDVVFRGEPVRVLIVRAEIAKRGKERQIPVSVRLGAAIGELVRVVWGTGDWMAERPAWTCGPSYRRITTRQVESIIRAASLKALGRPVHPHVLRHTFGTRIERVAGIRVAQELLGHADIRTTELYCHPNGDDLRRAVNGERRVEGVG